MTECAKPGCTWNAATFCRSCGFWWCSSHLTAGNLCAKCGADSGGPTR